MTRSRWIHGATVALCTVPAVALAVGLATDSLGADPVEALEHATGQWGLRFLVATLAVTPLRRLAGLSFLAPYRRTLGLFAFFYICCHLATYTSLDLGFDWATVFEDVTERPYITVGFTGFLLLLPLAITSTKGWIKRLGRRWVLLHRAVYAAAVCGVVHFLWGVKADLREPLIYAAIVALLLGYRVWHRWYPHAS